MYSVNSIQNDRAFLTPLMPQANIFALSTQREIQKSPSFPATNLPLNLQTSLNEIDNPPLDFAMCSISLAMSATNITQFQMKADWQSHQET
jgi:hypothetical protein